MSNFDGLTNSRRSNALNQYKSKSASNTYARMLSQTRGNRKLFDIKDSIQRKAPRVVSAFSQRGLVGPGVQSGVYQKAMQDFGVQSNRAVDDFQTDFDQEQFGFNMVDTQNPGAAPSGSAWADYQEELTRIEWEQKQQQIADTAETLRGFAPYLGN